MYAEPSLLRRLQAVSLPTLGHLIEHGFADHGIRAFVQGVKVVGVAATLRVPDADAVGVSRALAALCPGEVLVIDMAGDHTHAAVGAVTACAAQSAGAHGIIIDGLVTDVAELRAMGLPVFARGTTLLTTKRHGSGASAIGTTVQCGGIAVRPGDLVLADDNGVLFLGVADAAAIVDAALAADAAEPALLERLRAGEGAGPVILGEAR